MDRHDIIVIGGSMGAMEALRSVVPALPAAFPAAILIVVHLPPRRPTYLPRMLGKASRLPVDLARNMQPLDRGRIYIAPPDYHMLVGEEHIRVVHGPTENRHRPAVDPLFRTAAHVYGPRVVGVILTGALDCGATGLATIKQRGGIAVIQDPSEALCPEMPQAALNATTVDHIVRVEEIPALLLELAKSPVAAPVEKVANSNSGTPSGFSCPDCGGVLWESVLAGLPYYQCRVGHSFTTRGLVEAQGDGVEDALWGALRALEEAVALSKHAASTTDDDALRRNMRERAEADERRADVIRRLLVAGEPTAST